MKYIIALVFLATTAFAHAQTKDAVFTSMAAELCKEIKDKQVELKASDNIQMEVGMLMMPVFLKYEDQIKKAMPDFDMTKEDQLETLGIEVGKKLITCPEFLKLVSSRKDFLDDEKTATTTYSVQGTLQSVTPGEFTAINVKTTSGKVEKIWWMEFFDGAGNVSNGSLTNKAVTVSYVEREVYNATLKDYIKVKVVTGIK